MIREIPYPVNDLILYFQPVNLSMKGGTIETASFQKPKLLEYLIRFPKGFDFPPEFLKVINSNEEITLAVSQKHSDKNEIIFTGLCSTLYSRLMSRENIETRINAINTFRFQVLLEQQSIISLVSVLETFMKSVQNDCNQESKFYYHSFKKVEKALKKCGIKIQELEYLRDKKIFSRTEEIMDYAFNLRNLFVHNGGIIDESFYEKYKNKIPSDKVGTLIRIEYKDYQVIRQWISLFIQEICRVIEGYEDVWTDYVLSNGIILPDIYLKLKAVNGNEYNIPLEDGVELIGRYDDEIESVGKEPNKEVKTIPGFELDIGKLIKYKTSKTLQSPSGMGNPHWSEP